MEHLVRKAGPAARAEIVAALRQRISAYAPKLATSQRLVPTGIALIDQALCGGLPQGQMVEVVGTAGRMALSLQVVAQATRQGLLCAWIDTADVLDCETARAAGVVLSRVLWVRIAQGQRRGPDALKAADLLLGNSGFAVIVLYLGDVEPPARMNPWPRFQQRCEKSRSSLLVVSDRPAAGSFAAATLRWEGLRAGWQGAPGGRRVLRGLETRLQVVRNRLGTPGAVGIVELSK